jgi:hypothetical protein
MPNLASRPKENKLERSRASEIKSRWRIYGFKREQQEYEIVGKRELYHYSLLYCDQIKVEDWRYM